MKLFLCTISSSNKRAHIRLKQPSQLLRSLRSTYSVVCKDDGPRQPINAYSAQPLLKWILTWLVQVSNHHDRLPKAKIKVQFLHYPKHIIIYKSTKTSSKWVKSNSENRLLEFECPRIWDPDIIWGTRVLKALLQSAILSIRSAIIEFLSITKYHIRYQ